MLDGIGTVGALGAPKVMTREQQQARVKEVAREFEAIFVRQLLESTAQSAAVMGQEGEGFGQGTMMQQYHETMSKLVARSDGFGVASYLERSLGLDEG